MALKKYSGSLMLCLLLIVTIYAPIRSYGIENTSLKVKGGPSEKLVEEYMNWSINQTANQFPNPELGIEGSKCLIKTGPVNFLADPYGIAVKWINECTIKSGSSLLSPFLIGWCDSASKPNYRKGYEALNSCALDSNLGVITMEGWLDNNKIIDIQVNNKNYNKTSTVYDKLPQNDYYKVIKTGLFNFTISNNTRMPLDGYQNSTEFQSKPVVYKAVAQCFCAYLTNLTAGNHVFVYKTGIEGSKGAGPGSQDQISEMTYKLNVR